MPSRLRWGNLARLGVAVLAVALIVAWPRLAPPDPGLPGGEVAPLGEAPRMERPAVRRDDREASRGRAKRRRTPRARREEDAGQARRDETGRDARRRPGAARRNDTRRRGAAPPEVGNDGARGGDAPTAVAAPPVAASPPAEAPAPAPDPAALEFGFEGG